MKLFYYIKRFWEIPGIEKRLLLNYFFISLLVCFIVYLIPLKHYVFLFFKKPKSKINYAKIPNALNFAKKTLNRITMLLPFRLTCLSKSILFKLILNNLGVYNKLSLGVLKNENKYLEAHAFITIDDKIVYLNSKKEYNLVLSFD
jgi:hypothetical protein